MKITVNLIRNEFRSYFNLIFELFIINNSSFSLLYYSRRDKEVYAVFLSDSILLTVEVLTRKEVLIASVIISSSFCQENVVFL